MRHPEIPEEHGELAVGWLLHTLEPDQERRFLTHVESCEECRRIVGESSSAVESVGRALPQYDPPPGLRERILVAAAAEDAGARDDDGADGAAVDGLRASLRPSTLSDDAVAVDAARVDGAAVDGASLQPSPVLDDAVRVGAASQGAAGQDAGGQDAGGQDAAGQNAAAGERVVPLRASRRRWAVRGLAVAAVAAVVALVAGLAVDNRSLRDDRDGAVASADDAQQVVRMLDAASAPGVRHATLASPSGALVGLVADDGRGPRVLTTGLAGNRADQTYVLWGIADGRPVGLGAFDLPGSVSTVRSVPWGQQAGSFTGYAVSLEPGHTVPAAPTEIVASGQVGR